MEVFTFTALGMSRHYFQKYLFLGKMEEEFYISKLEEEKKKICFQ